MGGSTLILCWFRGIQLAPKVSDMSWSRGADLEPPKESLYTEYLGTEWREVEPGIFVKGGTVELDPPRLRTIPAASS
jgi:hypothetical protein